MESLGDGLLENDQTADFELLLSDGSESVVTNVHRVVLKTTSPFFSRVIGGKYFLFYDFMIPNGTLQPALNLLRYMYTRNLQDLNLPNDKVDIMRLCILLEMNTLYEYINNYNVKKPNNRHVKKPIQHSVSKLRSHNTRSSTKRALRSS